MRKALVAALLVAVFTLVVLPYLIPLPGPAGKPPQGVAPASGHFISVRGRETYIEEAGPAAGPAVILVHGLGGSTFSWRETLPALGAAGFRAVALDLPGFGLAEKRFQADYSHGTQADFVAGLMDSLQIEQATLVGHSMGGNVVAHFALAYPGRVQSLVIVDGAIVPPGGRGFGPPGVGPLLRLPPARRWARLLLRTYLSQERFAQMLRSAVADPAFVSDEVVAGYARPRRVKDWDLALLGIVRDGQANALPEPLSTIQAPALLIWGAEDTWVPPQAGERLQAELPQARLVLLEDAGHLPMEERPQAFNEVLLEFLRAGR